MKKSTVKNQICQLHISRIFPNPDQPRKQFEASKLSELAQSIKENGLIEPIVVVARGTKGDYMIICGERRFRASKIAGMDAVPVKVMHNITNQQVAELSLLENLQREDLTLIEEAQAYKGLMDAGLSMKDIAKKMGFKQAWRIRERTDLLRLDKAYQDYLVRKVITPSQAYEMSRVDSDHQAIVFAKIKSGKLRTYNELRAFVNAIIQKPMEQEQMIPEITEKEKSVGKKYDALVDKMTSFVKGSFSKEDMTVLKKVTSSNTSVNIKKIDGIISELNKIKKAMIEAEAKANI